MNDRVELMQELIERQTEFMKEMIKGDSAYARGCYDDAQNTLKWLEDILVEEKDKE